MRASNYRNHRGAYTPWNHAQMVRAALVEGIALRPSIDPTEFAVAETQRYRRLLRDFTNPGLHERIDHAYDILNGNDLTSIPDTLLTLPKLNYLLIRENDFDESEIKETIEKFEQKGVTVQYE